MESRLEPGNAFLIAYLPWRRVAYTARLQLLEFNTATDDPALRHSIEFAGQMLKVEDLAAGRTDAKLAALAQQVGVALPPMPPADGVTAWLAALPGAVT